MFFRWVVTSLEMMGWNFTLWSTGRPERLRPGTAHLSAATIHKPCAECSPPLYIHGHSSTCQGGPLTTPDQKMTYCKKTQKTCLCSWTFIPSVTDIFSGVYVRHSNYVDTALSSGWTMHSSFRRLLCVARVYEKKTVNDDWMTLIMIFPIANIRKMHPIPSYDLLRILKAKLP